MSGAKAYTKGRSYRTSNRPAVTYISASREDLEDMLSNATRHEKYLEKETVGDWFPFSASFLDKLHREGLIKKYPVRGHPKKVLYKYSELESILVIKSKHTIQ